MAQKIKAVNQYRYDILEHGLADGIDGWDEYIQSRTEYSSDGKVVREVTYNSWKEPEQIIQFCYDENDQLEEEKFYLGDEEVTESIRYFRGENFRIEKESHLFLDGSEDITEYKYNEESQLISRILTNSDGEIERKESFEYSKHQLVAEIIEESAGNLVTKSTYSYYEEGTIKESEQIITEDGRSERNVNYFDEKGKRVKSLKYNSQDQLIEINRFSYIDDRLHEIEDENQKGHSFIRYNYDEKGNVVLQEEMRESGEVVSTIERKFDEENRLLEATIYIDGLNYRPNQHYIIHYSYEFYE